MAGGNTVAACKSGVEFESKTFSLGMKKALKCANDLTTKTEEKHIVEGFCKMADDAGAQFEYQYSFRVIKAPTNSLWAQVATTTESKPEPKKTAKTTYRASYSDCKWVGPHYLCGGESPSFSNISWFKVWGPGKL